MEPRTLRPLLLLAAALMLLVGCDGNSQPPDIPTPLPLATHTPVMSAGTPTPVPTLPATTSPETAATAQQKTERTEQGEGFWNNPMWDGLPECTTDFGFSHQLVAAEDVTQLFFSEGGHIEPHEHMLYWGIESAGTAEFEELHNPDDTEGASGETIYLPRKIQLYAPTDIYRVDVGYSNRVTQDGDGYVEWGGYLYTCDGHQLMLGHIGEPSNEMLAVLAEAEPLCDDDVETISHITEPGCHWNINTFIPSGTPIFKSSGYTGAFDFGLSLAGLTAAELQNQPGYGYSITPWRVSSGRAVCPIEYFPEPIRSEYRKRLSDNMTGELFECGPFNQDVPGTAMGFWTPSPSPKNPPLNPSERGFGEWDTIWLSESNNDPSVHALSVGNNTFGLDYGGYHIATVSGGLVNRRWDSIKPGDTYCSEFIRAQDEKSELTMEKILIIRLSEDGLALTVEAINNDKCGEGPWVFQGGQRTFYR